MVFAPGFQLDFDERRCNITFETAVFKTRFLGSESSQIVGGRGARNPKFAVFRVFANKVDALRLRRLERAFDQGKVGFANGSRLDLFVESLRRFRIARENDDAGDRKVEPTNDAEINGARLRVFRLNITLRKGEKGRFARRRAHRRESRRFVDDQKPPVFKENAALESVER